MPNTKNKAFSLIEAVTALAILAIITSSVLVVINRCTASAANSVLRMQAFEVARNNMEALLTADSVAEMVEYGSSDKYPAIQWRTTVESFPEPVTSRMWVQAICSAEYTDTAGEVQTIELTHWLTNLSKEEMIQILEERQKEKERLAEQSEDESDKENLLDEEKELDQESQPDEEEKTGEEKEQEDKEPDETELIFGYTMDELNQMSIEEIFEILLAHFH